MINMIFPGIDSINSDIELLAPQVHKNLAIVPLKTRRNYNVDLLSLKKGMELGLADIKECEHSQVNTLIVENKSVVPLILIDGEEVVGGDQNRIINSTVLIAPSSSMAIPVSCTEQGRWAYKNKFEDSSYIANYRTRCAKEHAKRNSISVQSAVWSAIDDVEMENSFSSPTKALSESYDNLTHDHSKIIKSFEIIDGQNGVLIIVDGEIKGFELFLNSEIYREFHEKILKSYLIDSKIENSEFAIDIDEAKSVLNDSMDSSFEKREKIGIEDSFEFENNAGLGVISVYDGEIIHWSYFKKSELNLGDELSEDGQLESQI